MKLNGTEFTRTKIKVNGPWVWVTNPSSEEILAGAERRKATAAEARALNRMAADSPLAMSLPGVHPSYRV